MKVDIKPGRYILAVSGGVDSMVLLNLLAKRPGLELTVAHFNHGIRPDAAKDEQLVKKTAGRLGLPFEISYGRLGAGASEKTARTARYKFLEKTQKKYGAKAIITAHHRDDLIETAILNILRGTGRRGLVSILNNKKVTRPLFKYTKTEIIKYAVDNHVKWLEDPSNADEKYLRNYIRANIVPKLSRGQKNEIIRNISKTAELDKIINKQIAKLSQEVYTDSTIDRSSFIKLPVALGNELVLYWLRRLNVPEPDRKTVSKISLALRTSKAGTIHPVKDKTILKIDKRTAYFSNTS